MFMGGADPHGQPELRAASIRGAMRFWFRAIAGAIIDDPKEVYKLESEVFGNTERKSNVVVKVIKQPKVREFNRCVDKRTINYIGYGLYGMGGKPSRKCLWGDAEFELEFPPRCQNLIGYTLWFIQKIGGLGARSRKGFGSVQISTSKNDLINKTLNLPFQQMLQSSYLKEHVKKALDKLVKDDLDFVSESAFPSLSPHLFIYKLIMTNERDYRKLLGKINKIYRDLRRNLPPKKRLYLGFSHGDNRRSSPLYLRPIKFSEDDAFKILLFLFKNEIPDPDFEELFNEITDRFENDGRFGYA